jgi:hypothetical protein
MLNGFVDNKKGIDQLRCPSDALAPLGQGPVATVAEWWVMNSSNSADISN